MTLRRITLATLLAFLVTALLGAMAFQIGWVSVAGADDLAYAGERTLIAQADVPDAGATDPGSGSGSATPAPTPLPDPLEQPGEAISTITKLWRSGAITSSLIVAAFMTLVVLRRKVKWFSLGYRAAITASMVGGLGTVVDAIQRGLTPNLSMMIVALTTAVALFFTPTPKPPEPS